MNDSTRSARAGLREHRVCFVGLGNLPALAPEYAHLGIGGAELQQTLVAKALVKRGLKVSMVVKDYGQPDQASWSGVTILKAYRPDAGIRVIRFLHPRWTSVWAALQRADADIYYVSCAGEIVWQVALFARMFRRKTVFRVASDSDCDPRALLVPMWWNRQLYRYALPAIDMVLAQTHRQRDLLMRNFNRESRIVAPMAEPAARRLPFHERTIDVLWVSNFRPLKRAELLLTLAERFPGISFHMVGGPLALAPEYFESMRRKAATLPNVQFHGAVLYHEIGELFERARVLVNTSETEGFPNTFLQAWGAGAPVVTFLDPGEIIAREGLGRAVANIGEMQDAVAAFVTDETLWKATSVRCCRYMDREYDPAVAADPYLSALAAL
jgi:glycosyltransferase involved in cell wall biosynthesis